MDSSYVHTKKFIDGQIRTLSKPLQFTGSLKRILHNQHRHGASGVDGEAYEEETTYLQDTSEITPEQLKRILAKVNIKIRRHNSSIFRLQITNQIVQQVLKVESTKLSIINEQLLKINTILKPLLIPDFSELEHLGRLEKIAQFGTLLKELPLSKYLLLDPDTEDADEESSKFEKDIIQKVLAANKTEESLFTRYDQLKQQLLQLNGQLQYKHQKLNYLNNISLELKTAFNLKTKNTEAVEYDSETELPEDEYIKSIQSNLLSVSSDGGTLISEVNKFRILVEKIGFKLQGGEKSLRSVLHDLNDPQST